MPRPAVLSIRLDLPSGRIGPGKIALMAAVRDEGSIGRAAARLGMSYRRAWALTESLNAAAPFVVIEKRAGGASRGGAALTEKGAALLSACEAVVAAAEAASVEERRALDAMLAG